MSFKEGFSAIESIKASGLKLGSAVARLEALEVQLADLRDAQTDIAALLEKTTATIATLEAAAKALAEQNVEFSKLTQTLPTLAEEVLIEADSRFAKQQDESDKRLQLMPDVVEKLVEQKMTAIAAQLEDRLNDRLSALLRDELKETRITLREAFEAGSARNETKLLETSKEIIGEMPRALFGRRGR